MIPGQPGEGGAVRADAGGGDEVGAGEDDGGFGGTISGEDDDLVGGFRAFGVALADAVDEGAIGGEVAIGVAVGVSLGTFRIVTGTPLPYYIMIGYMVVVLQTFWASKEIIPLAYDSGGVTTSTVTVPVLAALGLGLASTIPGRSPLIDGFGLIAFASLFPIMAVMGYASIGNFVRRRVRVNASGENLNKDIDPELEERQ